MCYVLGGRRFETVEDVAVRAKEILNCAHLGVALEGGEAMFVGDLFSHHPDAGRKTGAGIEFFYVEIVPAWGTRNFLVCRTDGTFDNFSIKKCVASLTRTPEAASPSSPLGHRHHPLMEGT